MKPEITIKEAAKMFGKRNLRKMYCNDGARHINLPFYGYQIRVSIVRLLNEDNPCQK